MSSPLDRLEAIARASLGEERDIDHAQALADWALQYPWAKEGDDWLPYEETWYPLAHGVLALVAVARAAEKIPPEILAMLPSVREALARLDPAAAGKDTA